MLRVTRCHTSQLVHRLIGCRSGVAVPYRKAAGPLIAAVCAIMACQNSPTDSGGPPDGVLQVDSLQIVAPAKLLVNDAALLSAKVWRNGRPLVESPVTWTSSDPSIGSLSPSGEMSAVLTAGRRGTITIRASSGTVDDEITLRVTAELRIEPDYVRELPDGWPMAIGEQLQLEAVYIDVIGQPIEEIPTVTWSSTDAGVTVSPAGLIAATQANHHAAITAANSDDTVTIRIRVLDVPAGQPASVRVVHGISGLGPIRFLVSQAAPLSLSYGESVELPIVSGTLRVSTEGLPPGDPMFGDPSGQFIGVVRPGDHLSLYAAGSPQGGFLQAAWPPTVSIPPDSGMVRLVQSSPAMVVYLRERGAPSSGLPELCYFDPGVVSDYFVRPAGEFDVIGQAKYDEQQVIGRISASVIDGQAVTLVLTGGEGKQPLSILPFIDR